MSRVELTAKIATHITNAETQSEKLAILTKYKKESLIKRIVNYAYNPLFDYNMADFEPKNFGKKHGMGISKFIHIFEDILTNQFDKPEAIFACNLALSYINIHEASIFIGILHKEIGWNLEPDTINQVWPDINTGYPIQNPSPFTLAKFKQYEMPVVAQQLYSGLRINISVNGKNAKFKDSSGTRIYTLDDYATQFVNLAQHGDTVFDGVAVISKDGEIVESTVEEILAADSESVRFILWDAIRYDGFIDGKDTRIGYNWRYNGLEHMMMLAIESNPVPCYGMATAKVCSDLNEVRKFSEGIDSDVIIKSLSGTWHNGITDSELIFRK